MFYAVWSKNWIEREALVSLQNNKDIMIVPADKGRATVVMNTKDYKAKAETLLSDDKTYKKLKSNPTSKYKNKLINILKPLKRTGRITDIKYKLLHPTSEEVPKFYRLPKVHKNSMPLRPLWRAGGLFHMKLPNLQQTL